MHHWTRQTQGSCYIAHFSRPLGNHAKWRAMANHYVGFAVDLAERIAAHEAGRGARITAAAVEHGITFTWFAWDATLGMEKVAEEDQSCATFLSVLRKNPRLALSLDCDHAAIGRHAGRLPRCAAAADGLVRGCHAQAQARHDRAGICGAG